VLPGRPYKRAIAICGIVRLMSPDDLASEYQFTFRKDAKELLSAFPQGAGHRGTLRLCAWPGVVDACDGSLSKSEDFDWRANVSEIFGVEALDAMYRKAKADGDLGFWNLRLVPHAYVIAKTYGGDPIVQVARGRHAGKVLYTNHESYHGFFEHLASMIPTEEQREFFAETRQVWKKLGFVPSTVDTDQIVEFLLHKSFDGATVIASSVKDFYAQLGQARGVQNAPAHGKADARAARPRPSVMRVNMGSRRLELRAAASDGVTTYVAGGGGLYATSDGRTVTSLKVAIEGIEDIFVGKKELWVCGNGSALARSTDGGRSFQSVAIAGIGSISKETYVWGLTRDDHGDLWVAGSHEEGETYVAISSNDRTFRKVPLEDQLGLGRLRASTHGILIPSQRGRVWLGKGGEIHPTGLRASAAVMDVFASVSGALLAVDRDSKAYRSENVGKTWKSARVPRNAGPLQGIGQLPDGRLLIVGKAGFMALSDDDGKTFEELEHDRSALVLVSLHCVAPCAGGVLVGGNKGLFVVG
jgi:hypothetical protein